MSVLETLSHFVFAGAIGAIKGETLTVEDLFEKSIGFFTRKEYDNQSVTRSIHSLLILIYPNVTEQQAEALVGQIEKIRDSVLRDNPTIRTRIVNRDRVGVQHLHDSIKTQLQGRGMERMLRDVGIERRKRFRFI